MTEPRETAHVTPLDALWRLLHAEGASFEVDSPLHHDALVAGVALTDATPKAQADLFAPTPPRRLAVADWETVLARPRAYGGSVPAGAHDAEGAGTGGEDGDPMAWDESRVMTSCPRGVCLVPRTLWSASRRHCDGC